MVESSSGDAARDTRRNRRAHGNRIGHAGGDAGQTRYSGHGAGNGAGAAHAQPPINDASVDDVSRKTMVGMRTSASWCIVLIGE